jgi:hypothetical protein
MLSMPPATITRFVPALSRSCASMIAFMPEPHILLMVVQPVAFGRPAPRTAWRAGAWPWPAGSTQPRMASSTSSGFTPARSTAALTAAAPSCGAPSVANCPCMAPIGVRAMEAMTMESAADMASGSGNSGTDHQF